MNQTELNQTEKKVRKCDNYLDFIVTSFLKTEFSKNTFLYKQTLRTMDLLLCLEDIMKEDAELSKNRMSIEDVEWDVVKYIDCLDEKQGLLALPDNCVELGITDPVWNSGMKPNVRKYHDRELSNDKGKTFFNDEMSQEEFERWTLKWFYHFNRVCKKIVLIIPESSKYWWIRFTDLTGDAPVLWKNGFSGSKIASKSKKSTYLFYGKFEKGKRLRYDYIAKRYNSKTCPLSVPFADDIVNAAEPFTLKWGFCSDQKHFNHPSPKGLDIVLKLYEWLKPDSILDPFSGSGSYLKAAEIMSIKWLGYEIDPDQRYCKDIEYRFAQKQLERWI